MPTHSAPNSFAGIGKSALNLSGCPTGIAAACRRRPLLGSVGALLTLAAAISLSSVAAAAPLVWDPGVTNGTSPGGTGTWDTNSTGAWFNGTADVNWTDTTGTDTATFGGTGGSVTVAAAGVTANALTFNSTGYALSGGTVTLAGSAPTVTVTNSTDLATISSVVAGSGFTFSGAGTLLLSGANTFTGAVTVSGGTLQLGNASALGTTAAGTSVSSGGVLDLNGQTIGAEPLTLNGTGISSGGALINSSATAASLSGTVNIASASSIGGTGALTLSGIVSGSSGFTKIGANALTLSGANTFAGQLVISGGTVKAGNAAALGAGGSGNETVVQSGATLDVNGTALTNTEIVDIVGTGVGGAGALVNTGAAQQNALNRVVLTGDAAVGGTARFDIRVGTAPTLDLAGFTLTKAGANDFHVVGGNITSGNINITAGIFAVETTTTVATGGTITIGSTGTLAFYGNTAGAFTRDITSNGGTMGNLGSSGTVNSNVSLTAATTTSLNSSTGTTTTMPGVFSGAGALTKAGSDTFTLSGNNTYTGATAINAGRLNLSGTNASSITLVGGTLGGVGSTTGGLTLNSGNIALPGGASTAAFTANSVAANGATTVSFDATPVTGVTYPVLNYGGGGFSGSISNFGAAAGHAVFTDTGSAVSMLYQGLATDTWAITTGTWNTASTNWTNSFDNKYATGDATIFNDPGAASTVTVSGTVAPASILVNNTSNSYTFNGTAISGTGSLLKAGTGTLALAVQETYTGNTIVNGGILDLTGGGGSTGTIRGTATVYSGGTLRMSATDVEGYSGGAAALTVINLIGGTMNVNTTGNQTLGSATINLTGGTLSGIANSNIDFFGGGSTLNSFASSTTSTISATLSPLRQGSTTFTVAQGTTSSGIDLDISGNLRNSPSSANPAGAVLGKAGAGTMRLTAANGFTTSSVAINGGTLILGFGTVTSNILSSTIPLTLGGGKLSLTNSSGGAVTQTFSGLTTSANSGSSIVLGAANESLTLGALTTAGAASALNIDTSAGGADAATAAVGTSTVTLTGQTAGNVINAGFTVTDATGFDLATVNGSNQVVRLTGSTLLPASGSASSTNYRIDNNAGGGAGSSTLSVGSTQAAGSITVDTTAGSGTLTLGSGVTMNANTWNFGGVGTNTYTVTGGTGITSVASGGTINFNNYNSGLVTIASPIVANGTNVVNFGGTGTTLVSAANTYTGATNISSGTVRIGNATSLGTTAAGTTVGSGATLDLNGQAVGAEALTLGGTLVNSSATAASLSGTVALSSAIVTAGGTGNTTLSGVVSGAGVLTKTGNGTLTLSNGGNTFTGNIVINGGTLATSNQGNGTTSAFGSQTSARTITINSGATLAMNINNVFNGGQTALTALPAIVNMGGTLKSTNYNILGNVTLGNGASMTSTLAATSGYTGFEFKNGSTVSLLNTGGNTAGSTISSPGLNLGGTITFNVASVTGTSAPDLTISSVVANASADNGSVAGFLVKTGPGTLALTAASTYTGTTTINSGALLVSGSLSGTTAVRVATGSTLEGTGTITPGGTGALLVASGATIAPGTIGTIGTLTINSANSSAASVLSLTSGAAFSFDLNTGFSSDTVALTNGVAGDIAFSGNTINFSDLSSGALSPGAYTLFTANSSNVFSGLTFDGSGNILTGLTIGSGLSTYAGSSLQLVGNNIVLQVVPEPGAAVSLLGGMGLLLGLRRRRTTLG